MTLSPQSTTNVRPYLKESGQEARGDHANCGRPLFCASPGERARAAPGSVFNPRFVLLGDLSSVALAKEEAIHGIKGPVESAKAWILRFIQYDTRWVSDGFENIP